MGIVDVVVTLDSQKKLKRRPETVKTMIQKSSGIVWGDKKTYLTNVPFLPCVMSIARRIQPPFHFSCHHAILEAQVNVLRTYCRFKTKSMPKQPLAASPGDRPSVL